MRAVYTAERAIPELGVEEGDKVLIEPAHPRFPMIVFREFDRNQLPAVLDHIDHGLTLSSFSGPPSSSPEQIRRWLSKPESRNHPRPKLMA